MIQIINNNGITQLESILVVTPEVLKALQAMPPERMQKLCNDLKITHRVNENIDSDPISIVNMIVSDRIDVQYACKDINARHRNMLKVVEKYYELLNFWTAFF